MSFKLVKLAFFPLVWHFVDDICISKSKGACVSILSDTVKITR